MELINTLFRFPDAPNVCCAFFGRDRKISADTPQSGNISFHTGAREDSVLDARRAILAKLAPLGLRGWSECHQVHGIDLVVNPLPTNIDAQAPPDADGMMTDVRGLGLMIKTADCQPLMLAHKSGAHIMALHVGWRGNRTNFPGHAIAQFTRRYNLKASDLYAVRGPSLGPASAEFVNFSREWGDAFRPWLNAATMRMDLWNLTRAQLLETGIPAANIYGIDICTFLNSDEYFSHRRDKRAGRQAALIWISEG